MRDRAEVLGCFIDRLDMQETVDLCEQVIESRGFAQQMSINAAKLVALQSDAALREIAESCELVNADGQAVVWASRLLGDPLPSRVAGIDLMHELVALAERRGYRIFVLGAEENVLERAVGRLRERYPRLLLAGWRDGYYKDHEAGLVADEIRASGADVLFIAMSSPRKEYFLGEHGPRLGVHFVMGVGGAIDVVAGETKRAPVVFQRLGLEWLYRLAQEPRRLGKRYAVTNAVFARMVLHRLLGRARGVVRVGRPA